MISRYLDISLSLGARADDDYLDLVLHFHFIQLRHLAEQHLDHLGRKAEDFAIILNSNRKSFSGVHVTGFRAIDADSRSPSENIIELVPVCTRDAEVIRTGNKWEKPRVILYG